MLKCAILFCLVGTICTRGNSLHTVEVGEYRFPHHAVLANVKQAAKLNMERGNSEYFRIACDPADPRR